jgi:hypothetical protein
MTRRFAAHTVEARVNLFDATTGPQDRREDRSAHLRSEPVPQGLPERVSRGRPESTPDTLRETSRTTVVMTVAVVSASWRAFLDVLRPAYLELS